MPVVLFSVCLLNEHNTHHLRRVTLCWQQTWRF